MLDSGAALKHYKTSIVTVFSMKRIERFGFGFAQDELSLGFVLVLVFTQKTNPCGQREIPSYKLDTWQSERQEL